MTRAIGLAAALLTFPVFFAAGEEPPVVEQPPAVEPPPAAEASPTLRNLDEALKTPADLTLSPDETLGQAMQTVADRSGVAIHFSDPASAELPLGKHFGQEVVLKGLPLATVLGVVLEPMGLTISQREGGLLIAKRAGDERPATEKIATALSQETRMEFSGTPLRDALAFLGSSHGINVIVDEKDLAAAGVQLDDPVSAAVRGIPLEAALSLLLEPSGLTYVIAHDVLLVTTAERAAREIDTRAYDVTGVVGRDGYATEAANVLTELLEPRTTLAAQAVMTQTGVAVPLPQPRIVSFQRKLLVTASWVDQRRIAEILKLMESQRGADVADENLGRVGRVSRAARMPRMALPQMALPQVPQETGQGAETPQERTP
jgi:hypothetical protein